MAKYSIGVYTYMLQALNEDAKINQELILDYGLISELSVKVVEVLTKNDCGFFNVRVKLSSNSEVKYKHDEFILEKLSKPREITDFMRI
jgi:hypothetical protein